VRRSGEVLAPSGFQYHASVVVPLALGIGRYGCQLDIQAGLRVWDRTSARSEFFLRLSLSGSFDLQLGGRFMRVLIVEDDPKTTGYLNKGLSEHGFVVDVVRDGDTAIEAAAGIAYDVVILDVMLPGRDGWSVVSALRSNNHAVPVLFVAARDAVDDRVRDVLKRRATRGGQRLDLSPKEFALISALAKRPGEVMSRTLLTEQVWDMNFESDANVVDVAIRRLRRKVDDPFDKKLIHAVHGGRYVLEER
jgi:two-component system copper resistance phosphate regulon response regulator CusR